MHYLPYIKNDDFFGLQNYTRTLMGKDGSLTNLSSMAGVMPSDAQQPKIVAYGGFLLYNEKAGC